MWLDVFTFLCNKLNFIVFFSCEKKISSNVRKFSQEMDSLRYGGHMFNAKGEHNITLVKAKGEHNS